MGATDQVTLNSIVLIVLAAVVALLSALWMRSSGVKNKRIEDLEKSVQSLETGAAVTEVKMTPLWARAQKDLSETLHHPHAKDQETDKLLDKLEMDPDAMTDEETSRLKNLLAMRSIDFSPEVTDNERRAATVMPIIMDIVLEGHNEGKSKLELISVEEKPKAEEE